MINSDGQDKYIYTSCACPQGGSQGGFAATRRKADSPRHAASLCCDTWTKAHGRGHVPTTINIEIIWPNVIC